MSKEPENRPTPEAGAADQYQVERLVAVEVQREFDLFTGQQADRIFLKLYVEARTSPASWQPYPTATGKRFARSPRI